MPRSPVPAALLLGLLLPLPLPLSGCGEPASEDRAAARDTAAPSHADLSAAFRTALGAGRVEDAAALLEDLAEAGDGSLRVGTRTLPAGVARAALFDAGLRAARERIEVFPPDRPGALRAVGIAATLATPEDAARLEGTRRWVEAREAADLPGPLAAHEGPRVVFYLDDFHLGEALLESVGARWAKEGRRGLLRVGVLPILRGTLRAGIRRITARPEAELAGIARDVRRMGLVLEPGVLTARDALSKLGLGRIEGALVVLDRQGRIVGRRTGAILDPRPLGVLVQRVASR